MEESTNHVFITKRGVIRVMLSEYMVVMVDFKIQQLDGMMDAGASHVSCIIGRARWKIF